jgi:hypothetical protein
MEYLILNEESIPFKSVADANEKFPLFIKIVSEALANRIKSIRVSENIGKSWFEIAVCKDLPLREWLKGQNDKEFERKVKSFVSMTESPQIPVEWEPLKNRFDLCYFYLSKRTDLALHSLGATYLLAQLAISYSSEDIWRNNLIELIKHEIIAEDFIEEKVIVKNTAEYSDWLFHLLDIENQRKESFRKGNELWNKKAIEFPNLVFCGKSEDDLKNLSVSDTVFNQLWIVLKSLNKYCIETNIDFSLKSLLEKTKLEISDESDSVKSNPKFSIYRTFTVNGKSKFFGYHVKSFSGEMRLHFLTDSENRKIFIGYFGKHLPTKKFPK